MQFEKDFNDFLEHRIYSIQGAFENSNITPNDREIDALRQELLKVAPSQLLNEFENSLVSKYNKDQKLIYNQGLQDGVKLMHILLKKKY